MEEISSLIFDSVVNTGSSHHSQNLIDPYDDDAQLILNDSDFQMEIITENSHHSSSGDQIDLNDDSQLVLNDDTQMEIIPIDVVAPSDDIIETYDVLEDGSLIQVPNDIHSRKLTRKRKRNFKGWKRTIAKENRQSGKPYKTAKGKIQSARKVQTSGCSNPETCQYECMKKLNSDARQTIFDDYWALNDSEKRFFYVANVKKVQCKRKRTKAIRSQKTYLLNYSFNYMNEDVRVCQKFFVDTLNVDKGRVYYYFNKSKNRPTITPGPLRHGKHRKKVVPEIQKQEIRDHINRFPVVESHYCRQNTEKKYLYQGLNVATMYRLYVAETTKPAKLWAYRHIFNYEFNLSFFLPKKDRCDKCMSFEKLTNPTEKETHDHNLHRKRKGNASNERKKDREISPADHFVKKSAIGDFDMENVFQLPISNASIVFYKRKFAVLNLTVAINKVVYCAMWDESLCGREGTHIANALIKVLKEIVRDNPLLEFLTLWSDSCVPQNRNSIMSAAIQNFLNSSTSNLKRIEQKFSESGHGQVQEVDSAHSVVERFLRNKFIYSPPSLVEEFKKIPENKFKFVVVPMEEHDYLDYHLLASAFKYTVIPFTKIKQLTYTKNQSKILVKFDFDEDFVEKFIELKPRCTIDVGEIQPLTLDCKLSAKKISDIQSMFGIMPESDKLFYQNLFKNSKLQVIDEVDVEITSCDNTEIITSTQKSNKPSISQPAVRAPRKLKTSAASYNVDSSVKRAVSVVNSESVKHLNNVVSSVKAAVSTINSKKVKFEYPEHPISVISSVEGTVSVVGLKTLNSEHPKHLTNVTSSVKRAASLINLKKENPKLPTSVVSSVKGAVSTINSKKIKFEYPEHPISVISSVEGTVSVVGLKTLNSEHPKHLTNVTSSVKGAVSFISLKNDNPKFPISDVSGVKGAVSTINSKKVKFEYPEHPISVISSVEGTVSVVGLKTLNSEHPKHLTNVTSSVKGAVSFISLKNDNPKFPISDVSGVKEAVSTNDSKGQNSEHPKQSNNATSSDKGGVSTFASKNSKPSSVSKLICNKDYVDPKASMVKPIDQNNSTIIVGSSRMSARKRKIPAFLGSFELAYKRVRKSHK